MINRTHDLPVVRQCQLLALSRSTAYYQPQPISEVELTLRRRIDALHLDYPFAGSCMLRDLLRRDGYSIGRRHVSTLMTRMGIETMYRKPHTSTLHPAHPVYPYLLRTLTIDRPNQVWAVDITYIPMKRGFVYLCAVLDWASRRVLAWRLSNTLTTDFCIEAVQEAVTRYGTPDIFNTDQGSQFTSLEFTGLLKAHGMAISMDGRGCWRDTCLSSGCGRASNTRRCICTPTKRSAPPTRAWHATGRSTTRPGRTGRLTVTHRIECTSTTGPHGSPPRRQNTVRRHLRNGTFCPT